MEKDNPVLPHVVIFPFPAQGHVNSMLKFAEILCYSDLHITFLNTDHYHHRLLRHTDAETRFSSFPKFQFKSIPDGLPDDHPRDFAHVKEIFDGINTVVKPAFRQILTSDQLTTSVGWPPVTCVVIDGLGGSFIDITRELGIPSVAFRTASACSLWCFYCYHYLVQAGELPVQDMDKLVKSVPGMENFLRFRDLPSFYRAKDILESPVNPSVAGTYKAISASATILNTFDDLEGPIISQLTPHVPKIYTIGPLHLMLSALRSSKSSDNSLWEVDRSCIAWLDSQPSKSVLYVSFGSLVLMTQAEMLEIWYGLVNSGKRFLWVLRPDSVPDKGEVPVELTEGTNARGCIVGWSPQEEVLLHPAVGGFVTHSGWNSTLESIVAGVPMLCWPHMGDQQINSRYVSEVWKIGLDMKDACDRLTVEKMVNDLMDHKRDELTRSTRKLSEKAKKSVSEGGTSYRNLENLIEGIKTMNFKV